MILKVGVAVILCLFLIAASCHTPSVLDRSANAAESGDATAFISGCGSMPIVGYLYCRKREGQVTEGDRVVFYGPKGTCDREACTVITIYFPTGEPTYSVKIKKDKTNVPVSFKALTHKDTFDKFDRGFWPFTVKTFWKDTDGDERTTIQEGEIRLRVYAKKYNPLHETSASEFWGWGFRDHGKVFKLTTAGRAWVGNEKTR